LKILQIIIQTMEFTLKYLNSLKTLHSLKTLPHSNTLQELDKRCGLTFLFLDFYFGGLQLIILMLFTVSFEFEHICFYDLAIYG